MPVDYAKFTLKPYGFFPRNPALNVPAAIGATAASHCSHHASGGVDAAHDAATHDHGHGH